MPDEDAPQPARTPGSDADPAPPRDWSSPPLAGDRPPSPSEQPVLHTPPAFAPLDPAGSETPPPPDEPPAPAPLGDSTAPQPAVPAEAAQPPIQRSFREMLRAPWSAPPAEPPHSRADSEATATTLPPPSDAPSAAIPPPEAPEASDAPRAPTPASPLAVPPAPPAEAALAEEAPRLDGAGARRSRLPWRREPSSASGFQRTGERRAERAGARPALPFPWTAHMSVLSALATMTFLMFVLAEPSPRWALLLGAGAVLVGLDGTLRATWREPFASGADTVPYLFMPALYCLAVPVLIERNATGYAALWWTVAAGLGFAAIVVAEVLSARTGSWLYPYGRAVAGAATYVVAFAMLSMTHILEPALPAALLAAWLAGTMLAIELLREGEVDPLETTIFAVVTGLFVAQVRWLLYFLPIDGYLAGLVLLLVFFVTSGVVHAHTTRRLDRAAIAEYGAVATVGLALIVGARLAGIA